MKNKKVFALVDCNSFYCSCERVFRPEVRTKPVIVLSNNDGCAVALTPEAKELGIVMGTPYFKFKHLVEKHKISIFSSNYTLYADMSRRVVETLKQFACEVEVYSIDESFLNFGILPIDDFMAYGQVIRNKVLRSTGIPVGVGIGPTKTLAKAANRIAKKHPDFKKIGVCDFTSLSEKEVDALLEYISVEDVWGVGRQYSKWLIANGVTTALRLKQSDPNWIQKKMTIMGKRTVYELNGISCMPLECVRDPKKGIASTRSFGKYLQNIDPIKEAVALYTTTAAEKLRSQGSVTSLVTVFLHTNTFNPHHKQYGNSATKRLVVPTSHTPDLIKVAHEALEEAYREGYNFIKAGVIFTGIIPKGYAPLDAFSFKKKEQTEKTENVMKTIDLINKRWGKHTIHPASQGVTYDWGMKRQMMSPRYTSQWKELLTAKLT